MTLSSDETIVSVGKTSINDDIVGGFTVVANKAKVFLHNASEILPFWITNPTVFDPELSLNPLDGIPELCPSLRERLLSMGYTHLFPGSKRPVCRPRDACIAAPTGSGKTLAYAIPIVQVIDEADRVLAEEKQDWYRILEEAVYHPTTFAYNVELQFNQDDLLHPKLRKPPVMTIAHQYDTTHDITLQKILVSATLTHDPGPLKRFNLYFPHLFAPKQVTRDRSIMQVSDETENVTDQHASSVEGVSAGVGQFTTPVGLKEFIVCAKPSQRVLFLVHLVRHRKVQNILCFTNSRNEADRLGVVLSNFREISVSTISSGMPVDKRQRILNSFVSGNITILICTDAMARGMDVAEVNCVVNYEMPSSVKTYVHRVGRTARAGRSGLAYTLLDRNQFFHFKRDLRNVGKGKIKEMPFHGSQTAEFQEEYRKAIKALKSSVMKTSQSLHQRTVSQLSSHKDISSATASSTIENK